MTHNKRRRSLKNVFESSTRILLVPEWKRMKKQSKEFKSLHLYYVQVTAQLSVALQRNSTLSLVLWFSFLPETVLHHVQGRVWTNWAIFCSPWGPHVALKRYKTLITDRTWHFLEFFHFEMILYFFILFHEERLYIWCLHFFHLYGRELIHWWFSTCLNSFNAKYLSWIALEQRWLKQQSIERLKH